MTRPSKESYIELQRALRYLKGTRELTLTVGGDTPIFLFAMTDSSFGIIDNCRSHQGCSIYLGAGAGCIQASSKRSTTVSLSSSQAEADATVECIKDVIWLQGFFGSMKIDINKPTLVLIDNLSVVNSSNGDSGIKQSRHYIIKLAYIKDQIKLGTINIQHIDGVLNHSDILTKGLTGHLLERHTMGILGYNLLNKQDDVQIPALSHEIYKDDELL
jgi:hypothetical protein